MAKPVYRSKGPHQYHRLTALLQRGIHIALSPTFGPILPQRVLCFRSLLAKLETPRILNDKSLLGLSTAPCVPLFAIQREFISLPWVLLLRSVIP